MSTTKISQLLVSLPFAMSQMGFVSGILAILIQSTVGCWSAWMMNTLYLQYRHNRLKDDPHSFKRHTIQMHEVLGGLLGRRWETITLIFNFGIMFSFAAIQMVAVGNIVYYINDKLERRTWTLVLGSCFATTVFIPSLRNYRMWSFAGLVMIVYTALYMAFASFAIHQDDDVRHTAPHSIRSYFNGFASTIIFGAHAIPVELMDAMWQPSKYKLTSLYSDLFMTPVVLFSIISVYWAFGDNVQYNVFSLLPRTKFRDAAVVLMLLHQLIEYGILSQPLYIIVEKWLKVHQSPSYWKKTLVRTPVFLASLLVAIMFPFYGTLSSAAGSIFMTWLYVIPCAASVLVYWTSKSQKNAIEQPPFGMSWLSLHCMNLGAILWMVIMAGGFATWASISVLRNQAHEFGLFAKCYRCPGRRS
ncbi:auxin transporter-like protein 3 isoform X1 [Selaginella moellendorffii]|uniref:auxin transporter-like protein 3 isoform X1 n=2 Tax=Selaginella moellendorffii TaxID=88036 RepID=UPI000D1CCCC8|nr:auxin transporter-like protein 3 isoform X1 [Selaginella moellendorffii]|eukprot:XP_024543525.1 auxin transporter-like protein 3 isoform X1 [Selaginella moellendorffii]